MAETTMTVQIDRITFTRSETRGEDGAVWYLILSPCPDDPCTHVCQTHPQMVHRYERQGFRLGAHGYRADATPEEIAGDRANVWGWDGNREAPTILPSFLAAHGRPYRFHSFLRAGQLDVLGDSTVTLASPALACVDKLDEAA